MYNCTVLVFEKWGTKTLAPLGWHQEVLVLSLSRRSRRQYLLWVQEHVQIEKAKLFAGQRQLVRVNRSVFIASSRV